LAYPERIRGCRMRGASSGMRFGTVPTLPNRSAVWEIADAPTPEWPLISNLELRALTTSLPGARRHAREAMEKWGLPEHADDVELIVSELVTNAVEASLRTWRALGACPVPVRLWLASDRDAVLIQVWDSSPEMPIPQNARPDDERGRGLILVAYLRRAWGTYRKGIGKVVWVVI
jgi:anti-sigma regulatory factor (Ser/Thr protein kinase)